MAKTDVSMAAPMMRLIMDQLDARFTLHRLWEAPNRDAFLRDVGPRIRGVAAVPDTGASTGPAGSLPGSRSFRVSASATITSTPPRPPARRVIVTNTPDVLNEEVADLALGLLLATIRQLPQADRYLRAGPWLEKPFPLTTTLRERKIGMLGPRPHRQGDRPPARRFRCRSALSQPQSAAGRHLSVPSHPPRLARGVDVLIVITPGGEGTRHIVDARGAEGARAERHPDQRGARHRRRRAGAHRSPARRHDPVAPASMSSRTSRGCPRS